MPFLLFGAACFQEVPYLVIREELLQRSGDFALFIFADLCYACLGNSLLVDECFVANTLYHFQKAFAFVFQRLQRFFCFVPIEFSRFDLHYSCVG